MVTQTKNQKKRTKRVAPVDFTNKKILDTKEAGAYIGRSPRTLEGWRSKQVPGSPKFIPQFGNIVYRIKDLDEWLEGRVKEY